jgi:hypothetical protein
MKLADFKQNLTLINREQVANFRELFPSKFTELLNKQNEGRARKEGRLKAQILHDFLFKKPKCSCGKQTNWMPEGKYAKFCSRECADGSQETVDKRRATSKERFGGEPNLHPTIQKKKKKVFLEKYGVDNPSKSEKIKRKKRKTSLSNFGVTHWTKTEEGRQFMSEENPMYLAASLETLKKTNLSKYGCEFASQHRSVKAKMRRTSLKRYGVPNAGVLPKFHRKICSDRFGTTHTVQGYEPRAIEWLSNRKTVVSISSSRNSIPVIYYKSNRSYYTDLVVSMKSGLKRIIEVKGSYPLRCCFETNVQKFKAASKYAKSIEQEFWLFYYTDRGRLIKVRSPSRKDLTRLLSSL